MKRLFYFVRSQKVSVSRESASSSATSLDPFLVAGWDCVKLDHIPHLNLRFVSCENDGTISWLLE